MSNQQPKNNTKSIVIAVFFSVIVFILILVITLYKSLDNLNILISTNNALAISAFLLLSSFIITETIAKYRKNTGSLAIAAKTMGVFGLIFASMHILFVTVFLTGVFSKEWLSEQSISLNFAWAALVALALLFFGFMKTVSEKLGKKRYLYIQALGYFSIALIITHVLFIKNLSLFSVRETALNTFQKPEIAFVLAFLAIIVVARAFLYLLNKKASLQVKIIAHTLLYLTISAIIIISYLATAEIKRNYNEIFRSNRYTIDYIKNLSGSENEKTLYKTADTITKTSQRETTVFFLNNKGRIIHHFEK